MANDPATTRVITTFTKAADLECHIRLITIENVRVMEFRDYIPSLQEYGRGYWVPMTKDAIFSVLNGITDVAHSEDLA